MSQWILQDTDNNRVLWSKIGGGVPGVVTDNAEYKKAFQTSFPDIVVLWGTGPLKLTLVSPGGAFPVGSVAYFRDDKKEFGAMPGSPTPTAQSAPQPFREEVRAHVVTEDSFDAEVRAVMAKASKPLTTVYGSNTTDQSDGMTRIPMGDGLRPQRKAVSEAPVAPGNVEAPAHVTTPTRVTSAVLEALTHEFRRPAGWVFAVEDVVKGIKSDTLTPELVMVPSIAHLSQRAAGDAQAAVVIRILNTLETLMVSDEGTSGATKQQLLVYLGQHVDALAESLHYTGLLDAAAENVSHIRYVPRYPLKRLMDSALAWSSEASSVGFTRASLQRLMKGIIANAALAMMGSE